nr:hemicentin-2-like [Crassostrea gigas]
MVHSNIGKKMFFHSLLWSTLMFSLTEDCLASTVMYEKGSTVCLNFTINDAQITNVIKRNYSTICVSVTESIPPNVSPFGNKTMNCSITANKMSVCFGDFQIQDVGLFSLCDSATINSNCFENITLKIIDPPMVNTLSQENMVEGRDLSVTCTTTPGSPSSTTFYWTKVDNPGFRQNGASLQLPNIHRANSGTYRCTAENNYSNGEKGSDSQSMVVNVLYPPLVNTLSNQNIIEGRDLSVTCTVTPGNPSSTTLYWTKVDNPGFRQNGPTLQLYNIQRNDSGSYRCTAENNYNNRERGTHTKTTVVNVLYPPTVKTLSQQNIIEGIDVSITCQANVGNPSSTAMYWIKVDDAGFRQNGPTLHLLDIQRTSSGTYKCTAENNYGNGEKGRNSQSMIINVLYPPTIESRQFQIVNESEKVTITRNISSNPLSDVSWYSKTELLKTQLSVATTTFTIERATCIDTKNFTLVVNNGVGRTVTAVVELIVNCKPIPDKTVITLEVTFTTGIEFSTTIIAYPKPLYELEYKNGTRNNQMMNNITRNAENNFTIYFKQTVVDQSSFGLYYLRTSNIFGESTVLVIVIEQRKGRPETPRNISVVCERTQARVQWISSFNHGDPQLFTVIILNGRDGTNMSYRFHDNGENELHVAHVSNLQPSVTYWFYMSAKNSYGSSSSEVIRCNTVQEVASSQTEVVAGSVGGVLVLAIIVLILGIIVQRRYSCICNIAFEKKDRNKTVDTNKEASNYTTIQEQQEYTARNMYDNLTSNANANQYEDILKKDNNGYDK